MANSPKKFGYHFRYLRVDLDSGSNHEFPLDEEMLRSTIGGIGLGVRLLSDTDSAERDPLDSRASLFFVFSPLVGSPVTTSAKFAVVCKSPLTGRINDSLAGSAFAIAGKRTGYDAIEIVGAAERPSVILVEPGLVRIEPCETLWGKSLSQTETWLKQEYGSRYRTAAIGPAGEHGVRFATISHDGRHAGRGGAGAVLGSKNIKAVLVSGDRRVDWYEPDGLMNYAKDLSKRSFEPATEKYRELGTAANLLVFNRLNCLPTRNFQQNHFESAERIAPESISQERSRIRKSCVACTIGCEHLYEVSNRGDGQDPSKNVRLEYESVFALGPMCGIRDSETVLQAARICDELGMDTISAGSTVAFAMDCSRRGWIDQSLAFGNGNDLLDSLTMIGYSRGLGKQLGQGSRRFAERVGGKAPEFAPHVKGLEIPGYDPRKLLGMALGFAVGTRGADHNKSSAYEIDFGEGQSRGFSTGLIQEAIRLEDRSVVMDSMIFCKFLRGVFDDFYRESSQLLRWITGWSIEVSELKSNAAAMIDLKKRFNVRAGWTPDEDRLPASFFSAERVEDPLEHSNATPLSPLAEYTEEELIRAIGEYNRLRGWSQSGYPATVS